MVALRRNSTKKKKTNSIDLTITKEDEQRMKYTTKESQLLNAVNEEQPFQEATGHSNTNRQSMAMFFANRKNNVDSFGIPISQPDVSNPSRNRDERPLDTIRSFEYAITGDNFYKEHIETPRLGFRPRPEFPLFTSNVYASNPPAASYSQPVYTPPPAPKEEPKKKRGLFGRKKK